MGIIMANLKVRKELLDSEVAYDWNNTSYQVKLSEATQEQLKRLHELGVDVFEKPEKQ